MSRGDVRRGPQVFVLLAALAACSGSPSVSLTTKRLGHSTEAIGSYLYVIGGGGLNTIERSKVSDDGSLEPFVTLPDVTLASDRTAHTSAVIGNFVYVFGGAPGTAPSSSTVERAPINADGSIGSFAIISGVTLTTPRVAHASAVTASYVYVLGGASNGASILDSVERAPINADGSLGPFATVSGTKLQTARRNFSSAALGGYLYVFGGYGPSGDLDTIERSAIAADGSLGAFETLTDVKLGSAEFDQAFVQVSNRLYVTGGLDGGLVPSKTVASTSVAGDGTITGFMSTSGGLAVARGSHTATVANDFVYVIGGNGASGIIKSVERAAINGDGTLADFENLSD